MKNIKNSKVIKMLVLVLSLVFFTSTIVATSLSKYVTEENAQYKDDEENIFEHLDYTVNSVFVVKNQEELFAAINQGYTYVQLDQDIQNPLIVTQKAETLNADLILDLNGIEIQRNGYEPILNIKPGVRLTVVDTSAEQTGGLYNPVGSVFNITGGTLTVITGTFESGPRYSEYYSYNSQILDNSNGSDTERTLVEDQAQPVKFYKKVNQSANTWGFVESSTEVTAPIIRSYPEYVGNVEYNHGNLYFDTEVTRGDITIPADTYCYYRTSEDKAAEVNNEAAADWYYTYYVDSQFKYIGKTGDDSKDIKITIYGYEKTIRQASQIVSPIDYYAAIQMQSGELDVQNGGFYSYFGVDKTACVNSQGGKISIKKGKFSSRIPNAQNETTNSVSVKESDELAFDDAYFNNFKWSNDDLSAEICGNLAEQGESYCILNGGNATVSIGAGELYSSNNGIINMGGGELSILSGNFTKRVTKTCVTTVDEEMSAIYMKDGILNVQDAHCNVLRDEEFGVGETPCELHGIYMQNGTFDSTNTTYSMTGVHSMGIKMLNGKLNVINGDCVINGNSSYGIYSEISNDTDFVVTNSAFDITGNDSTGIYSKNGRVNISADLSKTISINGENGVGIHVATGGSVLSTNYSYTLNGNNSIGILADNGATGIDVSTGAMSIAGTGTYGIKSSISGDDKFTVTDLPITMTGGTNQTGIYSENGRVTVYADAFATISTSGAGGKGIHVATGGSVDSTNYSYTLNGNNSIGILADNGATGINVTNGSMSITGTETYGIKSSISGINTFNVKELPIAMTGGTEQTGIYSENGKVTVYANPSLPSSIATSGADSKGIHVLNGGSVDSTNYSYILEGDNSIGILAEDDATGINVTNGSMQIEGTGSFGINSSITGINTFNVKDLPITMTDGTQQTGIFAQNGRVNVDATSSKLISIDDAQGKGIHVGSGGSVVSKNYSYKLSGDSSYGIYSIAGLVDISGGDITLTSNNQCYGVYAFSATEQIQIDIKGAQIDVGYNGDNKTTDTVASVGVFLATTDNNNKITLTDTNIRCYEVGVLIDGGSLDIKSTNATPNEISTKKASSIIVKGGNVLFDSTCNYNITSSTTINNATTNSYNITLPTINLNVKEAYDNFDGVYVEGGDFTSNGNVNITHTGLLNTTAGYGVTLSMNTDESLITAQSYAIRVLGGKATVNKAKIVAVQGGGLRVSGGSAIFGYDGMNSSDITITTEGILQNTYLNGFTAGWNYCLSTNGGDAVYVTDTASEGVVIYGGTFTAMNGNGIWIRGNSDTLVKVYDGYFYGYYVDHSTANNSDGGEWHYGVYSHSGLKVTHGGNAIVTGGYFEGANGGLILRGTSTSSMVTAYVTGTLNNTNYSTIFAIQSGIDTNNDGITVFDYSVLYLGKTATVNNNNYTLSSTVQGDGIQVIGEGCAVGVNSTGTGYNTSTYGRRELYIYDGSYRWNGGTSTGTNWTGTGAVWSSSDINCTIMYPRTAGKP